MDAPLLDTFHNRIACTPANLYSQFLLLFDLFMFKLFTYVLVNKFCLYFYGNVVDQAHSFQK